jgi:hypothetical protein
MYLVISQDAFPQCSKIELASQPGEKITYEIAYNWEFIWIDAGEVKLNSYREMYEGNSVFCFEATARSYVYYDWIYKVRDKYISKAEPVSLTPLWFHSDISEGSFRSQNTYRFDALNKNIIVEKSDSDKTVTDTIYPAACTFDVMTAAYYIRSIDFSGIMPGDTIPVNMLIDGNPCELFIRFLGKEKVENRNGKKYDCLKFIAKIGEGTIFKGGEDLIVWVTDDKNRIPVMAEAKILVGSVKAYILAWEGLKYPLKSVD